MATSLQQLLDDLTATARTAPTAPTATPIEDVAGALSHLGRALTRLTGDEPTPDAGPRDRTAAELGAACATVGALWLPTRGPLADLAGAAADLIGRDRRMGASHRWAITVEVAAAADETARLAHRLHPQAAVAELTAIRRLAATVERDAQTAPPTAAGSAILDRLVPVPGSPGAATAITAPDAAAGLTAALDRGRRAGELTLREFRAATAAAEITSRYGAAVTAAATGGAAAPAQAAAAAWQLTGRITQTFDDGRPTKPTDPQGVIPWAQALAAAVTAEVGSDAAIPALRDRRDLPEVVGRTQPAVNQLPLLAEQLAAVVDHWSATGQLTADARDLPPTEDMAEDRVRDVLAGRRVQAHGHDLDMLAQAVHRAGALSTGLADALNRAMSPAEPTQRHLTRAYAQQVHAPGAAERLLAQAQKVQRALDAIGTSSAPMSRTPRGPAPQDR